MIMMIKSVVIVAVFLYTVTAYKDYQGYRVLQVIPQDENQLAALKKMNNVLGFEVDFWRSTNRIGSNADFMVTQEQEHKVRAFLADYKIVPKTIIENVALLVDRSMKEMTQTPHKFNARDDPDTFPLNVYHTHDEINSYLQSLQTTYSSFVSMYNLGKSYEGRDILCVKIGTPNATRTKDALFIDAGIHAREWIAPSTAIYTISNLVNGYSSMYRQLLDAIDIHVCPQVNPDGYEYSRLHDRLWRKTRTGPRNGCYGTDPNRNWPFHWGGEGTSSSPCSEIYTGPSALSEPNCQALSQFLLPNKDAIKGYLTLHSYGQDMLVPYGYTVPAVYPPDYNELRAIALQMASAIQAVHGTRYTVENSASLYAAAGASDDWSKSIGIKWVYTIELRDTGNNGFTLPASQIIPTGEETLPALIVVANRIMTGPN